MSLQTPKRVTPLEATLELTEIFTDGTHPLHRAYFRGDAAAKDFVREVYKAAHGDQPVEITRDGVKV